jgi:hypothetical protein
MEDDPEDGQDQALTLSLWFAFTQNRHRIERTSKRAWLAPAMFETSWN